MEPDPLKKEQLLKILSGTFQILFMSRSVQTHILKN